MFGRTKRSAAGWRRRLVTGLVAVLVTTVLGTAGWLVCFSSVVEVRSVTVHRPAKALLAQQRILSTAQVPMGTPMVRADLQAISDRVATLPEVAEVTVSRRWPNTISVDVTERTAAFALKQPSGYQLVDASGVAYHRVDRVPSGLTTVVADEADRALLTGLAEMVHALPKQVRSKVTRVEAPTRDQVTLILRGNVKVIWGSPTDSELKASVAVVLLEVKGVRTVDVSAPSHPTTR